MPDSTAQNISVGLKKKAFNFNKFRQDVARSARIGSDENYGQRSDEQIPERLSIESLS